MNDLNNYMLTRRSSLSLSLEEPGPSADQISQIVTIAARVPDHGKLAPWRFELWTKSARERMHTELSDLLNGMAGIDDVPKKQKGTDKLLHAPCLLAVISQADEHPKIPVWEQHLSVGAACMNCLIAANSLGFEAQWLTAWYVYEDAARSIMGLSENEKIAGLIHIGSSTTPKNERPRPDVASIFSVKAD